jgi:hypothetical protein
MAIHLNPTNPKGCMQPFYDYHNQGATYLGKIFEVLIIHPEDNCIQKIIKCLTLPFTSIAHLFSTLCDWCKSDVQSIPNVEELTHAHSPMIPQIARAASLEGLSNVKENIVRAINDLGLTPNVETVEEARPLPEAQQESDLSPIGSFDELEKEQIVFANVVADTKAEEQITIEQRSSSTQISPKGNEPKPEGLELVLSDRVMFHSSPIQSYLETTLKSSSKKDELEQMLDEELAEISAPVGI